MSHDASDLVEALLAMANWCNKLLRAEEEDGMCLSVCVFVVHIGCVLLFVCLYVCTQCDTFIKCLATQLFRHSKVKVVVYSYNCS